MAGAPMVELRGDLCRLCPKELAEVVGSHPNVLYTCHLESSDAEWAAEQYEAALRAVRQGRKAVCQEDLMVSFETVIAGTEKKNTVLTDFILS